MVRFKKLCKKEDMKDLEQISWHGILSNKITNYFLNKELTQYGIQIIYRPIFNRIWETTPTPKLKSLILYNSNNFFFLMKVSKSVT